MSEPSTMPHMPPSTMPSTKNRLRNVVIAVTLLPTRLLQIHHGRRAAPEALQPVELTLHGSEYVDDNVAEIQQKPTCIRAALASPRGHMKVAHRIFDRRSDCLYLPGVCPGTDDEVIGNDRHIPNI